MEMIFNTVAYHTGVIAVTLFIAIVLVDGFGLLGRCLKKYFDKWCRKQKALEGEQ